MLYGVMIIVNLIFLLLGYGFGRRVGNREGYNKALSYVPLQMKIDYFQHNQCPICNKYHHHKGGKK
ncbi:hypothetical protein [Alkaliphilus crotonatoxidans]